MSIDRVFANSFIYMIGSALPGLMNLILLPIFSHYISPGEYGVLALSQLVVAMFPLLFSLQLPNSVTRFYFDYSEKELERFLSSVFWVVLGLGVVCVLTAYLNLRFLMSHLFPQVGIEHDRIFAVSLVMSLANSLASIPQAVVRAQQRAKVFVIASVLVSLITLVLNVGFVVWAGLGLWGLSIAGTLSSLIGLLVFGWLLFPFLCFKLDFKLLGPALKYSLPTLPQNLAAQMFYYSDRFILEKFISIDRLGLYFFADKLSGAFKLFVNQINAAYGPYFLALANNDRERASAEGLILAKRVAHIVLFGLITYCLFSVEIHYILFPENYFSTWLVAPVLASAYIFRSLYCFSSSGLFLEKKTGIVALISVFAGAINLALNLIWIPRFGVAAAVFSTLISLFLTYALSELAAKWYFDLKIRGFWVVRLIFLAYLGIGLAYLINSQFDLAHPWLPWPWVLLKLLLLAMTSLFCYSQGVFDFTWLGSLRRGR